MHNRQWFSRKNQYGLETHVQEFEHNLRKKRFDECYDILVENINEYPEYWARQYKRLSHLSQRAITENLSGFKAPVYVSWQSFWPGFSLCDNQILDFLRAARPDLDFRTTQEPGQADLLVSSCYPGYIGTDYAQCTHILFLGENVRPRYDIYDYSYSFDISDYGCRNVYMPLWMFEIDWLDRGRDYPDRKVYPLNLFTQQKCINLAQRLPSIVYVGNNCEPFRFSLLNRLQANHRIDVQEYGSHTKLVHDKIGLISKYRATLAFENSYYPGYVTEKAIHAYLAGTPSLYWGSLHDSPLASNPLFFTVSSSMSMAHIESVIDSMLSAEVSLNIKPLLDSSYATSLFSDLLAQVSITLSLF